MLKTINCRDDSLYEDRGMWTSMKKKKRCIVIAQGFYEWLKKNNGKEKVPHFTKRKDGQLMCFAGLWDCVNYEGECWFCLLLSAVIVELVRRNTLVRGQPSITIHCLIVGHAPPLSHLDAEAHPLGRACPGSSLMCHVFPAFCAPVVALTDSQPRL